MVIYSFHLYSRSSHHFIQYFIQFYFRSDSTVTQGSSEVCFFLTITDPIFVPEFLIPDSEKRYKFWSLIPQKWYSLIPDPSTNC